MLIDTHCHIHDLDYPIVWDELVANARNKGVDKFICIGTDVDNSKEAVLYALSHEGVFASVGVHPNNCQAGVEDLELLLSGPKLKIVAVGEIGLDYHYGQDDRELQIEILKKQLDIAAKYNMPVIFHVREAFDDFWEIIDEYKALGINFRAVIHSFTDNEANLRRAINEDFLIGINGFSTFVKDDSLRNMYRDLPLSSVILETDAPYLTPRPFRGRINEPAYVRDIAEFCASTKEISVEEVEKLTTTNAQSLFKI